MFRRTFIDIATLNDEPELFRDLKDDDLLEIANIIENNITSKYHTRRLHRSIYRQTVLYRKFIRLLNEGLEYFEIAHLLNLRNSTTYFWLKKGVSPFTSYKIPPPTYDLGYVIGSGIGDGFIDSKGRITQYSWLKDEDFADAIVKSLKRLGVPVWKWKKRGWQVAFQNVVITELIKIGKKYPLKLLPILTLNIEIIKGALTGWFDAEGSAGSFNLNGYKYDAPDGSSTNEDIIKLMACLLDILDIHYTTGCFENKEFVSPRNGKKYRPKSNKTYIIRIQRCCIIKFNNLIGFRIIRKKEQLIKLIENSNFKKVC